MTDTVGPVVWVVGDDDGGAAWYSVEPVRHQDGYYLIREDADGVRLGDWGRFRSILLPPGLLPGECRRYQLREVKE